MVKNTVVYRYFLKTYYITLLPIKSDQGHYYTTLWEK